MPRGVKRPLPTPAMLRAARALLDIDQASFATLALVSAKTIGRLERPAAETDKVDGRKRAVIERLRARLESDFGIEFLFPDESFAGGVRLRKRI
jgi:predicted transcriptional regulator